MATTEWHARLSGQSQRKGRSNALKSRNQFFAVRPLGPGFPRGASLEALFFRTQAAPPSAWVLNYLSFLIFMNVYW